MAVQAVVLSQLRQTSGSSISRPFSPRCSPMFTLFSFPPPSPGFFRPHVHHQPNPRKEPESKPKPPAQKRARGPAQHGACHGKGAQHRNPGEFTARGSNKETAPLPGHRDLLTGTVLVVNELAIAKCIHGWLPTSAENSFRAGSQSFCPFCAFFSMSSYKREQVYCFYTSPLLCNLYDTDTVCMYSYF